MALDTPDTIIKDAKSSLIPGKRGTLVKEKRKNEKRGRKPPFRKSMTDEKV